MITLNIDLTTFSESEPFDPENIEETIEIIDFDEFIDMVIYVMCELNPNDEKVYVLAYGGDEDGIVFIDHITGNILDNINTQLERIYKAIVDVSDMNVFLFAQDNYNEAYDLALDMKELTGMLKWQLELEEGKEAPTVGNGGITPTSSIN
jgi:hypothetical protein